MEIIKNRNLVAVLVFGSKSDFVRAAPACKPNRLPSNGGAGERGLRTSFGIKLLLGMPLPQHRLAPFVLEPFRFTWKSSNPEAGHFKMPKEFESNLRHPICRVIDWENRLRNEPGLTRAQIGCDEGLSSARMSQMFSLLSLPDEARQYLSSLTSPVAIRSFAIRRLMALAKMPRDRQREAFEEMRSRSLQRGN